jgi:hypothetical protein
LRDKAAYKALDLLGNGDSRDVSGAVKALVDSNFEDVDAFSDTIDQYATETLDSMVKDGLQAKILEPMLNKGFGEVNKGLQAFLPESLQGPIGEALGGLGGMVAAQLGKQVTSIIQKKLSSITDNLMQKMLKGVQLKNEDYFNQVMCKYYSKEAHDDVKTENFMVFVFRFINTEQAKPHSALRARLEMPQKACIALFKGDGTDGISDKDAAAACEEAFTDGGSQTKHVKTRMKDVIYKLIDKYGDGIGFNSGKCEKEMCYAHFDKESNTPSCTVLCNHASAVAGIEFPDDHWFEAKTIADSLSKFVRLANEKREGSGKAIWENLQKYCPAPAI